MGEPSGTFAADVVAFLKMAGYFGQVVFGTPRRCRSAMKSWARVSEGAATIAMTSRLTMGRSRRTTPLGHDTNADAGTIVTPMPSAARWAAVRGLKVRNTGFKTS